MDATPRKPFWQIRSKAAIVVIVGGIGLPVLLAGLSLLEKADQVTIAEGATPAVIAYVAIIVAAALAFEWRTRRHERSKADTL
jgi:hypothetical protein